MYWQIIIQDKSNLSGKSVSELMTNLLKTVTYNFVQIYEFEGAADRVLWASLEKEGPIKVSRFLEAMRQVIQVDWGTFCLLKENKTIPQTQSYFEKCLECIRNNEAVIRCVDGGLFYIYTKNDELRLAVQKNYQCLSAEQVDIGSIEWPE